MTDDIKIYADDIDEDSKNQIRTLRSSHAFESAKIRIMPDVHAGKGSVIGFTADVSSSSPKIIPNVIGVDIGCGILLSEINKDVSDSDLATLDEVISDNVPSGFDVHESDYINFPDRNSISTMSAESLIGCLKCKDKLKDTNRLVRSRGTLGGGNHFIEIDRDENDKNYLLIHTGSRGLGLQVANIYQNLAYKECRRFDPYPIINKLKAEGRESEIESTLKNVKREEVDKDLAYLEGEQAEDYLHDMNVCRMFAQWNRSLIACIIGSHMGWFGKQTECVHNYVNLSNSGHIMVRKGAISAAKDENVIIPLNMRDGCILGRGKGNPDWNYSAPHGSGRKYSRSQAKKMFSVDEFSESMDGIFSTSVNSDTLDESPMAYKDSSHIMKWIDQTVEIDKILRPVYNFKAH